MIRELRDLRPSVVTRSMFWLAMALAALMSTMYLLIAVNTVEFRNGDQIGLDYRAFLAAGELVRSGNGNLLYHPNAPEFLALSRVPFVYPPWAAIAMVPWTFLPTTVGLAMWTLLGLTAMVYGLRSCGVRDWRPIAVALASFPAIFALVLGQSTFLFVGVVALSVGAMTKMQNFRAGAWLAAAGWKPHLLGGFLLLLAYKQRKRGREAVAVAVTTAWLIGMSALVLPGAWRAWAQLLVGSVDELASVVYEASLPGMIALLLGSLSPIRWIVVGGIAAILLPFTIATLRRSTVGLAPRLALGLGVWLLLMPHVVVYDVLLLVIPLGMAFDSALRRDVAGVGALLALALSVGPFVTQLQIDRWGRAVNISTLALIVAITVFWFWVHSGEAMLRDSEHAPGRRQSSNTSSVRDDFGTP